MGDLNKAELRRLAEATGGISWEASHAVSHAGERKSRAIYHYPTKFHCVEIVETSDTDPENGESIHDDAAWSFIGAANPAAVLSLLDECDKAEAESDAALAELQAAKLLLEQCNEVIAEDGGVYIELRCFLSGEMPASDVIALLGKGNRNA